MAMSTTSDAWGRNSQSYTTSTEKITEVATKDLVAAAEKVHSFTISGASVFDNGCGSGALSKAIKKHADVPLLSADWSEGMANSVKDYGKRNGWKDHRTEILDANNLSVIPSESFTHSMASFMLMLIPTPHIAVAEMYRVTKTGGMIAIANWCQLRGFFYPAWEEARRKLDPDYVMPEMMDAYWTKAETIKEGLEKAGFKDVNVTVKDYPWVVEDAGALERFVFETGNPLLLKIIVEPWLESGRTREEIQPLFVEALRKQCDDGKGGCVNVIPVALATGRK